MEEHYYSDIPPGGASLRGAQYGTPWFKRGITSPGADWMPDVDAAEVDAVPDAGPPATGPDAPNVIGGGDFAVSASFDDYTSADFGSVPDNIVLGE